MALLASRRFNSRGTYRYGGTSRTAENTRQAAAFRASGTSARTRAPEINRQDARSAKAQADAAARRDGGPYRVASVPSGQRSLGVLAVQLPRERFQALSIRLTRRRCLVLTSRLLGPSPGPAVFVGFGGVNPSN